MYKLVDEGECVALYNGDCFVRYFNDYFEYVNNLTSAENYLYSQFKQSFEIINHLKEMHCKNCNKEITLDDLNNRVCHCDIKNIISGYWYYLVELYGEKMFLKFKERINQE